MDRIERKQVARTPGIIELEPRGARGAFSRRRALTLIAVTAAGGIFLPQRLFAQGAGANLLPGADVCVLVPEVTEGPYYFDPALVRNDITEGKPGAPLLVRLQVVDAACQPQANARVDIWHCDASGLYSGYANQTGGVTTVGETFLRGTLFTDGNGTVEFASIYPGWYPGRTTHIHFKVFLDERNVLTGQIFFPEDLNNAIYASHPDYVRTATRGTFNANDGIARQAGEASIAAMTQDGETYLAQLIVGIDPNATSAGFGAPGGAGGAPGGFGGPPRGG
jgi:protocatechuate 3,4-dioxygenase beta subunit